MEHVSTTVCQAFCQEESQKTNVEMALPMRRGPAGRDQFTTRELEGRVRCALVATEEKQDSNIFLHWELLKSEVFM